MGSRQPAAHPHLPDAASARAPAPLAGGEGAAQEPGCPAAGAAGPVPGEKLAGCVCVGGGGWMCSRRRAACDLHSTSKPMSAGTVHRLEGSPPALARARPPMQMHWPVTGNVGPEVQPPIAETWAAMESCVDAGAAAWVATSCIGWRQAAPGNRGACCLRRQLLCAVLEGSGLPCRAGEGHWRRQFQHQEAEAAAGQLQDQACGGAGACLQTAPLCCPAHLK
jgi:hypothetical protein